MTPLSALIDRRRSHLLLIDAQTRLLPAVDGADRLVANVIILLQAARRLGVPITVTEQYPAGLGPTDPTLLAAAGDAPVFEKLDFSAVKDEAIRTRLLRDAASTQFILAGTEAHVCVLQTGLDLLNAGAEVIVVADAVASRTLANKAAGLERLSRAGAVIATLEMVLFEWLERAGDEVFRELSRLIR